MRAIDSKINEILDEYHETGNLFCSNLYISLSKEDRIYLLNILLKNNIDVIKWPVGVWLYDEKFICDNIESIIEYCSNIFILRDNLKSNEKILNYINEYIDNNPKKVTDSILNSPKLYLTKEEKEYYANLLYLIILDICKNENIKFSDIKYITEGVYSVIYELQDKVLKIGERRYCETFPNNPYIVKPLLRKKITCFENSIFLEVTEKIDVTKELSFNDIYDLYKKIRNLGLIYGDEHPHNFGYLLKDNIIHWESDLDPSDEALSLTEKLEPDLILKKGQLVICDADCFGLEKDVDIDNMYLYNHPCEKKFQEELSFLLDYITINEVDINSDEFNRLVTEFGFKPEYIKNKMDEKKLTLQ